MEDPRCGQEYLEGPGPGPPDPPDLCKRSPRQRAHCRGRDLPVWNLARTPKGFTFLPNPKFDFQKYKNPGDMELVLGGQNWTQHRVPVQRIEPNLIVCKEPPFNRICQRFQPAGDVMDLENAYEFLDAYGEWYLDRKAGVVYYMPRAHEDMKTAVVVAPVLEKLLAVRGTPEAKVRRVHFAGLTFAYGTYLDPNENGLHCGQANQSIVDPANSYAGGQRMPGNVSVEHGQGIRFERCIFTHLGAVGLEPVAGYERQRDGRLRVHRHLRYRHHHRRCGGPGT